MIRYLNLDEVLQLHSLILQISGGAEGIRDQALLESAIAQPRMTFGGEDLYPTIVEKASALGFSLIMNHPFVDGNKRVSHATMETFLILNGWEINAHIDDQENIIIGIAEGLIKRKKFTQWLKTHIQPK